MLVLSRKVGESIQIDGDIRVTVTQVRGGRVRLSISAPSSVRIAREEILLGPDDLPNADGFSPSDDEPDA
jgi:carbon storage regulator